MLWFVAAAQAWDVNSVDWAYQEARVEEPFLLNTDSFAAVGPADDVEAVFLAAIDTWNSESDADLYVEYGGRSTETQQGGGDDGSNVAVYGDVDFFAGLAVSTINSSGSRLIDCDTAFHRRNAYGPIDWWMGSDAAPGGAFDLANTMTHELGHCLGMNHSDRQSAIMYAYNTPGTGEEARHLSDDDRAGIQFLYGEVAPELTVDGAWLEGEVAHGLPVQLAISLRNIGDGSAWHVAGEVDGPALAAPVDVGNVGAPTPVGQRVGSDVAVVRVPWTVDCSLTGLDVTTFLADRRQRTWELALSVPLDCPVPDDAPTTGDDPAATGDDPAAEAASEAGCGCATGSGGPLPWALALLLFLRRR